MKPLAAIARKDAVVALGLISGTSADGVDAALVRVKGSAATLSLSVLHSSTIPYPPELRARVLAAGDAAAPEIAELNFGLGRFFADAALQAIAAAGLAPAQVDVVGSHGQTVHHAPPSRGGAGATLQLGDGCVLARRVGAVTVSDFRAADMAAGGEGAPLMPYLDWILFKNLEGLTVSLNLGGIANVTFVPGCDDAASEGGLANVMGFDTGPANMILDQLANRLLKGAPPYDRDGKTAARGKINRPLLNALLDDPFYKKKPPKSTGREAYGARYVDALVAKGAGLSPEDLLATAAALTAETVFRAVNEWVPADLYPPARIVVSGGGIHNCPLMAMLDERFYPIPLMASSAFGVPAGGKEAVLFAVLACETLAGAATAFPAATGAAVPSVLGKISLPPA